MDYLEIAPGIEEYTKSQFLINFRKTVQKYPHIDFSDCMSRNQIKSKAWLIQKMIKYFGTDYENIFILCGWYGVLAAMITDKPEVKFSGIRTIDLDPHCEPIADSINYELFKSKWKFKAFSADILNINYDPILLTTDNNAKRISEKADLIINTSCEHISDFKQWIDRLPNGQKVILQSNNYDLHAQHTNCSDSLEDFISQCNLNKIIFSEVLAFEEYDRYMLIGEI